MSHVPAPRGGRCTVLPPHCSCFFFNLLVFRPGVMFRKLHPVPRHFGSRSAARSVRSSLHTGALASAAMLRSTSMLFGLHSEEPSGSTSTRDIAAEPKTKPEQAKKPPMHRGVMIGSWMSFISVAAAAISFPFMQTRRDALGCDALCQGGQTSLRSGLMLTRSVSSMCSSVGGMANALAGWNLIGYLSRMGHKPSSWAPTSSRRAAARRIQAARRN